MIILNLLPPEEQKKKRFFKKRTPLPAVKSETVFINSLPHYIISATEEAFLKEELFGFLKKYKGQIIAPPALSNNEKLLPLIFDISEYNKKCAFSALRRYLKSGNNIDKTLYIADKYGALAENIPEALPFIKSVCILTSSPFYGDTFERKVFSNYGIRPSIKPYEKKKEAEFFADFDSLALDGTLTLLTNGAKKTLRPELIRKKAEGANKLRALGIEEKYIYAAF